MTITSTGEAGGARREGTHMKTFEASGAVPVSPQHPVVSDVKAPPVDPDPRRQSKGYSDRAPLDLADELRGLIGAYGEYPGIVGDLSELLIDLEQRRTAKRRAS